MIELEVYKKSDFYDDFISSQKEYYEREQVDTLLAEKDREIALLKEHIANGDVSRITWIDEVIELKQKLQDQCISCPVKMQEDDVVAELKAENAELKKKLMPCLNGDCILTCEVVEKYGKENAELKQKLEDAKATAYTESVDAGMENRRLKRALWLARAERALAERRRYCAMSAFKDVENDALRIKWCIIQRKCLKKAEEYR